MLKLALLLTAVDPSIGGVLIRGEKGTAKSTAVRALAALLPVRSTVRSCPFSLAPEERCQGVELCGHTCAYPDTDQQTAPVVTLPLNATEDRLIGGIDMEAAIRRGQRRLSPGLLARAHGGFLYVDEVNLLDDHLVDLLLDAAAGGSNIVEREGMSLRHPARFVLVGTMNPEEGEIRPHFLDRFALCVHTGGDRDLTARVLLLERRQAFDRDAAAFMRTCAPDMTRMREQIAEARLRLSTVCTSDSKLRSIGMTCTKACVAGHRADIALLRSARAHAAFRGSTEVRFEDIEAVEEMVLSHRRREAPPIPPRSSRQPAPDEDNSPAGDREREPAGSAAEAFSDGGSTHGEADERVFESGAPFRVRPIDPARDRVIRRGSGRRCRTRTAQKQGRYVRATATRSGRADVAPDATIRAAAPHQLSRGRSGLMVVVRDADIREKVRERRIGTLLCFLVDASGSMGARSRMIATKGAVLSLLLDAYQKRDRVSMAVFRGAGASMLLPPTPSIERAAKALRELPVGGRTPLSSGLSLTGRTLHNELMNDPSVRPLVVIVTDGRANVAMGDGPAHREALGIASKMAREVRARYIVVDTEIGGIVRLDLAHELAKALRADYHRIDDLRSSHLIDIVRRTPAGEHA